MTDQINWQDKCRPTFPENSLRGYRATQIIIDDPHAPLTQAERAARRQQRDEDFPEIERWKARLASRRFCGFEALEPEHGPLNSAEFRRLYLNEWRDEDEDTRL